MKDLQKSDHLFWGTLWSFDGKSSALCSSFFCL